MPHQSAATVQDHVTACARVRTRRSSRIPLAAHAKSEDRATHEPSCLADPPIEHRAILESPTGLTMATIPENAYRMAPDPRSTRHLPGEAGTWVFIMGDMTAFAVFFATYLHYRGQQRELFASSQHSLVQSYGVTNTLLLLTSSLCVVLGMRAVLLHGTAHRAQGPSHFVRDLVPGRLPDPYGLLPLRMTYGSRISATPNLERAQRSRNEREH